MNDIATMTREAVEPETQSVEQTIGFYPGSFDPATRGHFDIVRQALALFDIVEMGIGQNPKKKRLFNGAESALLIEQAILEEGLDPTRVRARQFHGSLMERARQLGAKAVVRGLRQASDFNDEFVLHGVLERTMEVPVVYLICRQEFLHVSSSTARELASLQENVDWLVHASVQQALVERLGG